MTKEHNYPLSTVHSKLPMGWEIKKLGEVLTIERGGSPRPIEKYLTNSPDGINWIKISDATASDKYIFETKEKITKEGLHKTRMVNEGDFILSNSMSFGRPYIMKTSGCIHDGWLVLKENGQKIFDTEFLYYLLSSPYVFNQFDYLAAGSTVRNLNIALVSSVQVPIPPLPEQQRIVSILDKAFAAIAKAKANAEQNLKNAKELFESYLQGVFENGKWETKTIEMVCDEIFAGGDAPKNNYSLEPNEKHNIPIYANAVKDRGLYGYTDFARVTKPCVTIAARGSGTGHTELRNEPFLPIVRLIVCIPDIKQISTEFLKYTIDNLVIQRSGSAIPQLTVPMIKDYKIPVPSIEEQKLIIENAETLKQQKENLESVYLKKIEGLEELKKSILQKAFAGELRSPEGAAYDSEAATPLAKKTPSSITSPEGASRL